MTCRACRLTKASGKRSHHAHDPDCPHRLPPTDKSLKECGICEQRYHANGMYPRYCKPCFEKWSG